MRWDGDRDNGIKVITEEQERKMNDTRVYACC